MRIPKVLTVWFMLMQAISAGDMEAMASTLSDDEESISESIRFEEQRNRYIASHALARSAVCELTGSDGSALAYVPDQFGKPSFVNSDTGHQTSISLSKTDGMVACAQVEELDMGVDIEFQKPENADRLVVEQLFSEPEQAMLAGLEGDDFRDAFFKVWTLKEAYVKAEGHGLSIPLDDFAFHLNPPEIRFLGRDNRRPQDWIFKTANVTEDHTLALAVRSREEQVRVVFKQVTAAEVLRRWRGQDLQVRRRC